MAAVPAAIATVGPAVVSAAAVVHWRGKTTKKGNWNFNVENYSNFNKKYFSSLTTTTHACAKALNRDRHQSL